MNAYITAFLARRGATSAFWASFSCRGVQFRSKRAIGQSSARFSTKSPGNTNGNSCSRGANAVRLLPSYLADARAVEKYCAVTCPHGALQLGVAENQMLEDILVPALSKFGPEKFASDLIYYQPTQGREGTRKAMAEYLERILQYPFKPDNMVVGAGCNAVLENLCICLAEQGETVMIPTPYYAAFEFDLVARAGLSIIPVKTFSYCPAASAPILSDPVAVEAYYPNRASLDAAYEAAVEKTDRPPRVLLLSHPNNPLGICYPPHVVQECIDWCREREVHLVSDEIYAGSAYAEKEVFVSAAQLAATSGGGFGNYVHVVYALSKDFALSGLRVGAVYTEYDEILLPLQKLNDLCQISSHTQILVENMLTAKDGDEFWTDSFLRESHSRLRKRRDALQAILDEFTIPYLPGEAGLFLWMDFRELLSEKHKAPEEQERCLYMDMMKNGGCLFTPGLSMRHELPGFFRCVFTAATDDEFQVALERLPEFIAKRKSQK